MLPEDRVRVAEQKILLCHTYTFLFGGKICGTEKAGAAGDSGQILRRRRRNEPSGIPFDADTDPIERKSLRRNVRQPRISCTHSGPRGHLLFEQSPGSICKRSPVDRRDHAHQRLIPGPAGHPPSLPVLHPTFPRR